MNWYNQVAPYLGKWSIDTEVTVDRLEHVIKNVCESNGLSYYTPNKSDINFITYESLAQIFLILATKYADQYQLPLTLGIVVDRSKITKNLITVAEMWEAKANIERSGISNSITMTKVERIAEYGDEAIRLAVPVLTVTALLNDIIRIQWDIEESPYFDNYKLYLDDVLLYTTTNRYLNYYDLGLTTGRIELRKYTSITEYSFAEAVL